MTRYRAFLVIAEPPRAEGNVIPLRSARVRRPAPISVGGSAAPGETSWRDLVRRLAKKLRKR